MSEMISMAEMSQEIVDCRYLQLEMSFYLLDQQRLNNLAESMRKYAIDLLDGAFLGQWTFDSRNVKPEQLSEKIMTSEKWLDYWFEGAVFGRLVHNITSFRQYKRFLKYPEIVVPNWKWERCNSSVDYPEVYKKYFANAASNEDYKAAILNIFNEPGRKKLAVWHNYDVSCAFSSNPHACDSKLYYGNFHFIVAYACLGEQQRLMPDKMAKIARQVAQEYGNISARVMLSPRFPKLSGSGQHIYFPSLPKNFTLPHPAFNQLETERALYAPGAEWFNVLSPLQAAFVPHLEKEAKAYPQIAVETIPGGGKAVFVRKTIEDTDVADLMEVKELIYDALLPGVSVWQLKEVLGPEFYVYSKPRINWELTPIFEDEIDVHAGYVVFRHVTYLPDEEDEAE